MENFDDDDDSHFCNKCNETIHGLDNYVLHRRTGCVALQRTFFGALELQSSAISHPQQARPPNDPAPGVRVTRKSLKQNEELRRTKRLRKDKSPEDAKEKLSLLEPDLPTGEFGLPTLEGYQDIVVSASTSKHGKTSILETSNSKIESYTEKHEDPVPDFHVGPWLPSNYTESHHIDLKESIDHKLLDHRYDEEYDSQQEEDFVDEDSVEEEEEDSYSDSDDADYPPRSHTGGKWKPEHVDDVEMEDAEHHHHRHPPPNFTGGKWKPTEVKYLIISYARDCGAT